MTEREWLACDKPHPMLTYLRRRGSNRKLRLYACGSCRRFWGLLRDGRSRRAVEVAEQYADGLASHTKLKAGQGLARAVWQELASDHWDAPWGTPEMWALRAAAQAAAAAGREAWQAAWAVADEHQGGHSDTLRDVFGNPFRGVNLSPAWLAWEGGTVAKLAQTVYDGRAFDRLPVLADALEEAGCDNAELLRHCRQPAEHVRGCWVIDLLTGRG